MSLEYTFELNDSHQLLLRILFETGGQLNYSKLEKVFLAMRKETLSFGDYVRDIAKDKPFIINLLKEFANKAFNNKPVKETINREVNQLEAVGLITRDFFIIDESTKETIFIEVSNTYTGEGGIINLTDEGNRIAKRIIEERRIVFRPNPIKQTTIFIACAFGYDEIDYLYETEFLAACNSLGYKPIRVDMSEPNQTITELIMDEISRAACILADLTYTRPSVYFEVGYGHGLGVPMILTAREDHYRGIEDNRRIHFDLEQYKISFWSMTAMGDLKWQKGMSPSQRLSSVLKPYPQ